MDEDRAIALIVPDEVRRKLDRLAPPPKPAAAALPERELRWIVWADSMRMVAM
jgi:hypothetical protein